jgi:hypothetical protein
MTSAHRALTVPKPALVRAMIRPKYQRHERELGAIENE